MKPVDMAFLQNMLSNWMDKEKTAKSDETRAFYRGGWNAIQRIIRYHENLTQYEAERII